MDYDDFACLGVERRGGVAFITLDHPPINLFDAALIGELARLAPLLAADDSVRVLVFQSADPEFFIAHADVGLIQRLPRELPPVGTPWPFHQMVESYRLMPKVSIGKIEGRARGGGSEFLLSLDMRFAAIGRAILSQPEVALGILPGGSGTQRLPRLMGRARALEIVLGCEDFDAETAERYGWVNRALPAETLTPFVEDLALRIASFPPHAIALAKTAVDAAELPTREGLAAEAHAFLRAATSDAADRRMTRFLASGGQTRDAELDLAALLAEIAGAGTA